MLRIHCDRVLAHAVYTSLRLWWLQTSSSRTACSGGAEGLLSAGGVEGDGSGRTRW